MCEKIAIKICLGSSCYTRGNDQVLETIKDFIKNNNLSEKVDFRGTLCSGNCQHGPNLKIGSKKYIAVDSSSVIKYLSEYFESELNVVRGK